MHFDCQFYMFTGFWRAFSLPATRPGGGMSVFCPFADQASFIQIVPTNYTTEWTI
jgi:hypothetical protein